MGCCLSRPARVVPRDEQNAPRILHHPIIIPELANGNPTNAADGADVPATAAQGITDATAPGEVVSPSTQASPPVLEQPASNENIILEPRVYSPPAPRVELDLGPIEVAPNPTVDNKGKGKESGSNST